MQSELKKTNLLERNKQSMGIHEHLEIKIGYELFYVRRSKLGDVRDGEREGGLFQREIG